MKNNRKLLLLLFALMLAFFVLLIGCTRNEVSDVTEDSQIESSPNTDLSANSPIEFAIVSDGVSDFKIIIPSNLKATETSVEVALEIRKMIAATTNVELEVGDDWLKSGEEHDTESYEILVGYTNYPETAEVMRSISYGQYAIRAIGNKIVFFSYTDSGYTQAMFLFQSLLEKNTTNAEDGTKDITLPLDSLNITRTNEKMTASLPIFQGGTFSEVLNMGDGCYGVIIKDTTTDAYNSYLSQLINDGYKTHATNDIGGSLFATLYTDKYTVNAGYYNGLDEVRVIIEPYRDNTLAPNKTETTPVTTTQLTMLGVESIYNGEYQQSGLCLIYRLSTGEFIIVDGGYAANSAIYAANIIKTLREQAAGYAKDDKDITIAAWIITHPHVDHQGMLLNEYKQFTGFNFKSIWCNFWSESDFNEFKNSTSDFADGSYAGYYKSSVIAKEIGADFIVPHVGQVYWYGDTAFEILYTVESYLPNIATSFNTSSLVFRTITTDASGKTTTVMVTGDATGHAFNVCNKMYANELKSDIVQVAHHGAGTGGADNGTQSAYAFMKPSVVLWPIGANYYLTVYKNSFNHMLLAGKNPNFTELYIAGWQGNAVTLHLPYTVGTAITNNVVEPKK